MEDLEHEPAAEGEQAPAADEEQQDGDEGEEGEEEDGTAVLLESDGLDLAADGEGTAVLLEQEEPLQPAASGVAAAADGAAGPSQQAAAAEGEEEEEGEWQVVGEGAADGRGGLPAHKLAAWLAGRILLAVPVGMQLTCSRQRRHTRGRACLQLGHRHRALLITACRLRTCRSVLLVCLSRKASRTVYLTCTCTALHFMCTAEEYRGDEDDDADNEATIEEEEALAQAEGRDVQVALRGGEGLSSAMGLMAAAVGSSWFKFGLLGGAGRSRVTDIPAC
jgi:hypothetical protein